MDELKQSLRVEKIANSAAKRLLDAKHPLGCGQAFAFALGVFWRGRCEGVMTFGNPISNNAVKRYGLRQCDVLELRKLWMSAVPTKNSESRALAIAARIIRHRYPQLQMLLTYCEAEERASAYKAAGWIPQESHQYVREFKINGRWLSARDANRHRVQKLATETKKENRRKYILPLTAAATQLLSKSKSERSAGAAAVNSTIGTSTTNKPSAPLTGTASIGRTLSSSQAKSSGSAPQQAAASSSRRKGRQSTSSTTANATPTGSPS